LAPRFDSLVSACFEACYVAPVIDRKLRDLRNAGSAPPGGSCRRFRRRP